MFGKFGPYPSHRLCSSIYGIIEINDVFLIIGKEKNIVIDPISMTYRLCRLKSREFAAQNHVGSILLEL